jgi:hypothetical protein
MTRMLLGKFFVLKWSVSVQKRTMAMAYFGRSGARMAISLVVTSLLLAMFSTPAQGLSRENGEFWTYEMTISGELIGLEAELSGLATYTVSGEATLTFDGTEVSATVITLDGYLSGLVHLLNQNGRANVSLSGTQYELIDAPGILEDNLTTISDVTFGSRIISFTYHQQEQVTTSASPPPLAEFESDKASVGDSWTQAVELVTTTRTWEDGAVTNTTVIRSNLTYHMEVVATELVETPSGVHSTLKIRVSDDAGDIELFWWSAGVDNFVKHEVYGNGSEAPTMTMILSAYGSKGPSDMTGYIIAGVVIFVIGAAVLAMVVLRKRPGKP